MRIVYNDPIEELVSLIEQLKSTKSGGHIAITTGELRACLAHAKAKSVFPKYMAARERRLADIKSKMGKLQPMINSNALTDKQKEKFFNQMDVLEEQEAKLLEEVPTSLMEGGVTIKVSMR